MERETKARLINKQIINTQKEKEKKMRDKENWKKNRIKERAINIAEDKWFPFINQIAF